MPTAVDASRGVNAKYDDGDTTTIWNLFLSSSRDRTNPDQLVNVRRKESLGRGRRVHPDPSITTRSRSRMISVIDYEI